MQNPKCKRVVVVVKRLALLTHFFGAVVQHFCKTTAVQISMFGAHFSKKGVPTGALMKQFKWGKAYVITSDNAESEIVESNWKSHYDFNIF